MRNGIPTAYYLFRTVWSVIHLAMLAALLAAVIMWSVHDGQGVRLLSDWWKIAVGIWESIFYAVPFPWDM